MADPTDPRKQEVLSYLTRQPSDGSGPGFISAQDIQTSIGLLWDYAIQGVTGTTGPVGPQGPLGPPGPSGPGGSHAILTGLDQDDHPQYLTNERGDSRYVNLAGDSMSGTFALSADPVNPMEAATKQYVDTKVAEILNQLQAVSAQFDTVQRLFEETPTSEIAYPGAQLMETPEEPKE